jgi:signal peptidase I
MSEPITNRSLDDLLKEIRLELSAAVPSARTSHAAEPTGHWPPWEKEADVHNPEDAELSELKNLAAADVSLSGAAEFSDEISFDLDVVLSKAQNPAAGLLDDIPESPGLPELISQLKIKSRRRWVSRLCNVLFYAMLLCVLIGGLTYGASGNRNLFGYSILTVLTSSMQREIPQGSLIIVQYIDDPDTLEKGDDITFLKDKDTTVTHRIVNIYENYEDSGARGFQTKGLENPSPDKDIVYAGNIVGKVVFHFPGAGDTLVWIRNHWLMLSLLFAGLVIAAMLLKFAFGREPKKPGNREPLTAARQNEERQ